MSAEHRTTTEHSHVELVARCDAAEGRVRVLEGALYEIDATPFSMVNDSESLQHSIKTIQFMARTAIAHSNTGRPMTDPQREPKEGWQREVLDWAVDKFGPIALDRRERAMRFVEEAIELAQAEAVMGIEVSAIVNRVFSRAQGYTLKEIAQAGLTLEALAENIGTKVAPLIQQEIERINAIPKEEWQRRHAAKQAVGIALPAPPKGEK